MGKKSIRKKFRENTFKRDNYKCKWCGKGPFLENTADYLDAHHITDRNKMPNGGYVPENGISLCKHSDNDELSCHMKAEQFHISDGKKWIKNMHPNDLYFLINSNIEIAFIKSQLLK